jgi:hypothetical protein
MAPGIARGFLGWLGKIPAFYFGNFLGQCLLLEDLRETDGFGK